MAAEGMDLIVTSRRARARPPTTSPPRSSPASPAASWSSTRRWRRRSPRSCAASPRRFNFDEEAVREANRKQAMVPEGAIALDPVGTAPGLVVPAGERVVDRPARPAARAAADVAGGAGDRAGARGAGAGDAAARLHAAHVRHPRVRDRQEPARDRGRRGRRCARSRSPPACGAARSRSTSATATRRAATAEAVRARPAPSATARHLFSLDGETIDAQVAELLPGHRLGLAESCSGGLLAARITDLPGASDYIAGSVVAYSNEAKAELLGVDPALIERQGRGLARGRRGDGDRARWSASRPTSRSRSPASPGPTAAARRSRSATSASTPASPTATSIARDPVIPGGRADIRERSALVGMHLLRMLLSGAEAPI